MKIAFGIILVVSAWIGITSTIYELSHNVTRFETFHHVLQSALLDFK